jgi:hypothetical protein
LSYRFTDSFFSFAFGFPLAIGLAIADLPIAHNNLLSNFFNRAILHSHPSKAYNKYS